MSNYPITDPRNPNNPNNPNYTKTTNNPNQIPSQPGSPNPVNNPNQANADSGRFNPANPSQPGNPNQANAASRQYSSGTVSVETGSATIKGSGTSWDTSMNGSRIDIAGNPYEISTVNSTTELQLTKPFSGQTAPGLSHTIYVGAPGVARPDAASVGGPAVDATVADLALAPEQLKGMKVYHGANAAVITAAYQVADVQLVDRNGDVLRDVNNQPQWTGKVPVSELRQR